ncbi:MAG: FG-GAP-like repeat-containing protein [Chloroflexota bacterium]
MRITGGAARLAVVGGIALPVAVLAAGGVIGRLAPAEPPTAAGAPRFVEEAESAGLVHAYDGDFMYFVGGGVATFDCDHDGREDLYIAGGEGPAVLFRNLSPVGGELRFERVDSPTTDLTRVTGAYPLDIDGDAEADLAVLRIGGNVLLRGRGDCTFEEANERWAYEAGDAWTAAFSATWEATDAMPTLAFGNYLVPESVEARTYVCDDSELVRPSRESAAYGPSTALAPGWCPLSMLFSDWDRSGRRDLRVSNDRHYNRTGAEQLWRVEPGEAPQPWTADEGWQSMRIFGMGIASHDLTGDGYPEVYLTNQADNKLQTLANGPSEPRYRDIAIERHATAHRPYAGGDELPSTAWHAQFEDVNNDAFTDLFVAKGNVEEQSGYAMKDPSNLMIAQADGSFVEGAPDAGIVSYHRARGAALADLNLDGLLDLVVVNRRENVSLWRNVGAGDAAATEPMGHWLALRVVQDGQNRDAIGAWLEVEVGGRVLRRELTVGGGHARGQLGWTHVGLGDADRARLRVQWPDGEVGPWLDIDADGFSIVDREAGTVEPWAFGDRVP